MQVVLTHLAQVRQFNFDEMLLSKKTNSLAKREKGACKICDMCFLFTVFYEEFSSFDGY